MKLRGYLALLIICVTLFVLDPVQRLAVAGWVRLRPGRRRPVLAAWQQFLADFVLGSVSRIGGASIPDLPVIPGEPGTLILMNHQSLFDIPLVVASVRDSYPRIVTRRRYQRWIPLISHMVRLYQYPVVDPGANPGTGRKMLASLTEAARTSDVPLAIFPEGTRTKDGDIARFRKKGLRQVLAQRPWTVYVLVADGFWETAKFKDLTAGMAGIRGRIGMVGPLQWIDPQADPGPFIEDVRRTMVEKLASLREMQVA